MLLLAQAGAMLAGPGVFSWARMHEAAWDRCLVGALASLTVWVALTAGILAASGRGVLGALFRGGAVADTALIALVILWLQASLDARASAMPSGWAVAKIYIIWVSMALVAAAGVCLSGRPGPRYVCGMAAGVALLLLCAGPFWTSGWIERTEHTDRVAAWAVRWNPFYGIAAGVNDPLQFIWHQDAPRMYDKITRIGTDVEAPPPRWYDVPWRLAGCMAFLTLLSGLLRLLGALQRGVSRSVPASREGP
jgi:hypothetical protein